MTYLHILQHHPRRDAGVSGGDIGPVAPVLTFRTDRRAHRARQCHNLWSGQLCLYAGLRADHPPLAEALEYGLVCVNDATGYTHEIPFGGFKESGLGREGGHEGLEELSLSRLNHRLPRNQAYPEVMQGTAEFHHEITDALLPQTNPVFHDATALHTAVHVLDAQPTLVEYLVGQLLLQGQFRTAGLLRRHEDLHLGERE